MFKFCHCRFDPDVFLMPPMLQNVHKHTNVQTTKTARWVKSFTFDITGAEERFKSTTEFHLPVRKMRGATFYIEIWHFYLKSQIDLFSSKIHIFHSRFSLLTSFISELWRETTKPKVFFVLHVALKRRRWTLVYLVEFQPVNHNM